MPRKYFPLACVLAMLVFHAAANFVWLRADRLPQSDDNGYHLVGALKIADIAAGPAAMVIKGLNHAVIGFYPPLFHTVMAVFSRLFDRSAAAMIMANIPFMLLLLLAVYGLGARSGSRTAGVMAGCLLLLYPYVFLFSRLSLPDFALMAVYAAGLYLLAAAECFSDTRKSLAFGLCLGAGMLTKQVYIFFILVPFLAVLFLGLRRFPGRRSRIVRNAALALSAGALVSGYWYLSRFAELKARYIETGFGSGAALLVPFFSRETVTYYAQQLYQVQIGPVFFAFLTIGALLWLIRPAKAGEKLFLLSAVLGPFLLFSLICNKNPKTTMPCLPVLALITARGFAHIPVRAVRGALLAAAIGFGLFQFVDAGFMNLLLPPVQMQRWRAKHPPLPWAFSRGSAAYGPATGDFQADGMFGLIARYAAAGGSLELAGSGATTNTPEKSDYQSNLAANCYAVEYECAVRKIPCRMTDWTSPQEGAPRVSVVSDYMEAEYLAGPGKGHRRMASFSMPDSSRVILFEKVRR